MAAEAEKMIELTIDGKAVSVPEGATILDAAKKLNISIPTLCHNDALKPYGSCWVCAVKVEGARTMVPSCSTKAGEGMIVTSNDAEVRQTRKLCLELLLSDHTGDCLGPCQMTCPAGIDVQGYIAHVARGEHREALKLIKERNPLPLICGRVCPRPCEDMCRRNLVDEPVAVDSIKRFVADLDRESGEHYIPPVAQSTGKNVAVVGGGPAGLTCAYFLAQRGHKVKIFEALPKLGGMLRWGIPAYRLPRDVLDDEINTILELGVDVEYNKRLGTDYTVESLRKEFDSVFLGLGATVSRKMRVEGEEKDGVMSGTDFLRDFGLGKEFDFTNKRVAIIGGGNTAIDACRTSVRLGAKEVTLIYRRSRAEMPAEDIEVKDAEEEGVKFHFLAAPTKILGDEKLTGLEFVRMTLGEPDASGRRRPIPVEGSETELNLDIVIAAIGQIPDLSSVEPEGIEKTSWGAIAANEKSLAINVDGVFAGGDCVNGAATVVESVAHGREGAISIDAYLNGLPVERTKNIFNISKGEWKEMEPADFEHFLKTPRQHGSCMDIAERIANFDEVECAINESQAMQEAERCLECGCNSTFDCRVRMYAAEYDVDTDRFSSGDQRKELPDNNHPLIQLEMQKCIMCGSCVRTCDEIHDVRALGFTGRGFSARVRPAFGEDMLTAGCISCGGCVDVCPTGAISESMGKLGGPFNLKSEFTTCTGCGVGCVMEVQINSNGKLIKVRQIQDTNKPLPNKGAFCIRGRFAHRAENSMAHLESATVSGKAVGASIALEEASKILKNANGNTVVTVSPHATIEEVALAKNVSMATGSKLVSVDMIREREAVAGLGKVLSVPASPKAVADIETSDCIFVVDCNPLKRAHVAGTRIRVAYENGKEVIVLSTDENSISKSASFNLRGKDGSAKAVMAAVLKKSLEAGSGALAGSEKVRSSLDKITADSLESASDIELSEIEDVVKRLSNAESPLIVIDMLSASEEVAALAAMTAATLSDSVDNIPLLALRDAANSDGLARMGVEVANLGDIDGKVILSIRENPLAFGGKAESLIVADALACEGANVMLMLPSLNEVSGTVCSTGGVLGTLCGTPAKKVSDCENIFASLADECCDAVEDMDKLSPVKFNEAVEVGDVLSGEKAKSPEIFADTFAAQFRNWAVERKFV